MCFKFCVYPLLNIIFCTDECTHVDEVRTSMSHPLSMHEPLNHPLSPNINVFIHFGQLRYVTDLGKIGPESIITTMKYTEGPDKYTKIPMKYKLLLLN